MPLLQDKDREYIKNMFAGLEKEITLTYFTQEIECQYCADTRRLLEEVSALSDKINLKIYDFLRDKEIVDRYQIDKIPATVVEGDQDYGIRFYGIPSGYEFSSLLEDIVSVSKGDSGLSEGSKALVKVIDKPLRLQVFITPTCPHCPKAVRLAHQIAMENKFVTADMVEATEFPHLSMKYNVRGVPRTMVGEELPIEGGLPEKAFIEKVVGSYNQMQE